MSEPGPLGPPSASLAGVLAIARTRGYLGRGDLDAHIRHATGFAIVVEGELGTEPTGFADLGSGGGVPGLVLALRWPTSSALFVEVGARRARDLRAAVETLGLGPRATVAEERAEVVAHDPEYRERWPVVTARGFGAPAVTAEIASGLVAVGGIVVVSEPPRGDVARWPEMALRGLGLGRVRMRSALDRTYAVLRKEQSAPPNLPRRSGIPQKRPHW